MASTYIMTHNFSLAKANHKTNTNLMRGKYILPLFRRSVKFTWQKVWKTKGSKEWGHAGNQAAH